MAMLLIGTRGITSYVFLKKGIYLSSVQLVGYPGKSAPFMENFLTKFMNA